MSDFALNPSAIRSSKSGTSVVGFELTNPIADHVIKHISRDVLIRSTKLCVRVFLALYPLSYGTKFVIQTVPVGLEPTTSCVTGMYSNSAVDRFIVDVAHCTS